MIFLFSPEAVASKEWLRPQKLVVIVSQLRNISQNALHMCYRAVCATDKRVGMCVKRLAIDAPTFGSIVSINKSYLCYNTGCY